MSFASLLQLAGKLHSGGVGERERKIRHLEDVIKKREAVQNSDGKRKRRRKKGRGRGRGGGRKEGEGEEEGKGGSENKESRTKRLTGINTRDKN